MHKDKQRDLESGNIFSAEPDPEEMMDQSISPEKIKEESDRKFDILIEGFSESLRAEYEKIKNNK